MECTTLCYIEQNEKFLMLYRNKKKKDINHGKWIGVGGHKEQDESIEECLLREVYEETGLRLTNYTLCGKLHFYIDNIYEVSYVYKGNSFEGTLSACDEGHLEWIPKEKIMDLELWEGDYLFMNKLINHEGYFEMKLVYKQNKLIEWQIL
ncbi:MAG: 8-oxo-dGTP diphosphatase [Anaeroplasmataceae bacterium]|nr:8-oxo-dGTP diphosphatase [Anaeroplasmataceae bacterium]